MRHAAGCRFAIVVSQLQRGDHRRPADRARARRSRRRPSADDDITVMHVPGAFEIPVAALRAAETGRFDAVICLGCLIKGDTMHFEYIASAASHGHHGRGAGDRRADGVRRADDADRGAGGGARGRRRRQQGARSGAAAVEMATLFRAARREGRRVTRGRRAREPRRRARRRSRATARARRRCRCSTSGRSARLSMPRCVRRSGRTAPSGDDRCPRTPRVCDRAGRRRRGHVAAIDPLIAEAAEHWRIERMNVMDRLILRLAVYEFLHEPETPGQGRSSTRRWSWRAPSAATSRCASSTASSTRIRRTARTRMTHCSESDQVVQRRANLEELRAARRRRRIRAASTPQATIDAIVARARRQDRRRSSRRAPITTRDGRAHPRHPQLRQGELPGAVGRQGAHPGLRPAGRAAGARLQDLQAARFRRLRRRRGTAVPHQDQRAHRSGRPRSSSSPSACCRCRRSGTACRTSRSATASGISI